VAALRRLPLRIVLLLVGFALLAPWIPERPPNQAAAAPIGAVASQAASCEGDEQIGFAPPSPHVGQTLLIAVSSQRAHVGVWLSGPPL